MEPLDPELRRIVREGLAEAAPGPEVEARVLAGLLRRLPGDGGQGGPDEGAGGTGAGTTAAGSTTTAGLKALLVIGLVGGGAVVLTTPASAPPSTSLSSPSSPAAERAAAAAAIEPAIVEAPAEVAVSTAPPRRPIRKPPVVEVDPLLAETHALAEAEAALASGDHELALRRARALARSHPTGQLTLEREAVELCARCGLREPGAGAAAQAFLAAHADAAVAGKIRLRCADALQK